ncbi:LamG-like jellyroll fold domain-containing protein [Streptomyces sp. NPDC093248]|uniref:LamG-like jellyroll fold domain-containing protein n=1 Tax=Streptomyces sp. NPDC093248 TaxID=3155072 RepID=UPI00341ABC65
MALLVEMGWGGQVQLPDNIAWTDISQYASVARGVTITRGAADELAETQPGTATLTLDNDDGRFTPGNAGSPYYPYVRRNAPIRIAVALIPTRSGTAPYPLAQLGDDFDDNRVDTTLWTAGGGAVETGGRMRLPMTPGGGSSSYTSVRQWTLTGSKVTAKFATVPAAGGSSAASVSMYVLSQTSGTQLRWRYDAVTGQLRALAEVGSTDGSPTILTYNPIDHAWLRIRESGGTVYFETSGDGAYWTVRRTLATPAWVGTDQAQVQFAASRTGGTGDWAEFDLVGATVKPRFYGVVNEFPVDWEGLVSTVQISCTDLFKRLNKLPALRSMLSEEISGLLPTAYYPLTEPDGSASFGDLSGNGQPSMAITQAGAGGTLTLAAEAGPPATGENAPTFTPASATAGKYLAVDLGASVQQALTAGTIAVEAWFKTTTTSRAILSLYSPDLQYVHVLSLSASGALQIEWTDTGSSTLTVETISGTSGLANGAWHHVVWDQSLSGNVCVDGVNVDPTVPVTDGVDIRFLQIGGYRGTRLWSGALAHVALWPRANLSGVLKTHYDAGWDGFEGESADSRVNRFCSYAGPLTLDVRGSTHDPIASQGTGGTNALARMREVETTESGKLFAARDGFRMIYQSRDVRYNPAPSGEAFQVDYADLETRQVELADDDQKMVNDVTGSRPGGATQRVIALPSIQAYGLYPQTLDILKTSDNSVLDASNWLVSRYADPAPELREVPIEAYTMPSYASILDADISSYFSVTSLPSQAPVPTMRVTVEGYTETIGEASHRIQFHTSATVNDSVWVLDDPVYSALDSTTRLAY